MELLPGASSLTTDREVRSQLLIGLRLTLASNIPKIIKQKKNLWFGFNIAFQIRIDRAQKVWH